MAFSFDIHPFVGALPIQFGMRQSEVRGFLGPPEVTDQIWDGSGTTDYWNESGINVGYDNDGNVKHFGFSPGSCDLYLQGELLWTVEDHPDPNPMLLRHEPAPLESLGFLIFPSLGISTGGYHDDDENQLALTVSPAGVWDEALKEAKKPDLRKYE